MKRTSFVHKNLNGLANYKALANEDTLLRTHCRSWCFLGCANWKTFVADTKCFWTKSEKIFVSRTQNLSVSATNVARAGKRGNICVGNNVSSFARPYSATLKTQRCLLTYFLKSFRPKWWLPELISHINDDQRLAIERYISRSQQIHDVFF